MNDLILLKEGEVVLKGLNRRSFEHKLVENIRRRLRPCGEFTVTLQQSVICVEPRNEEADMYAAFEAMRQVFGILRLTRAAAWKRPRNTLARSCARRTASRSSPSAPTRASP